MSLLTEDFYNEVFSELLQEGMNPQTVKVKIILAIQKKFVMEIFYNNEKPGRRIIEPFALGVNAKGTPVVRAWVHENSPSNSYPTGKPYDSHTHIPGWRMFNLNKISRCIYAKHPVYRQKQLTFDGNRPNYNPNDSDMRVSHYVKNGTSGSMDMR
jgi:hypothetical protein